MHRVPVALAAIYAPLWCSCATFADIPHAAIARDLNRSPLPSAYLEVSVDAFMVTAQGRGYRVAPWGWPWLVEESLSDSGLFSAISREQGGQDLRVSVSLTTTQTPMSNALLSVLTGFLVPASDERSLTVVATIYDPEHSIEVSARSRHEFRTWLQLFLLPLWFTHDPGSYEYDLAAQLSTSVVSEALGAWAASLAEAPQLPAAARAPRPW